MNLIKLASIVLIATGISACASDEAKDVKSGVVAKRINTTECKDSDDWYLDGYRVGKSFRTEKEQMLQQRSGYCGYRVKQLPSQYRDNWERGYQIGIKG